MRRDRNRQIEDLGRFVGGRGETLAADLDILLGELCRMLGFCNHLSGADLLGNGEPLSAERFAIAVLTAEGFPDPHDEVTWNERLRRIFAYRYGPGVPAEDGDAADWRVHRDGSSWRVEPSHRA
jgi:hypothetical protein